MLLRFKTRLGDLCVISEDSVLPITLEKDGIIRATVAGKQVEVGPDDEIHEFLKTWFFAMPPTMAPTGNSIGFLDVTDIDPEKAWRFYREQQARYEAQQAPEARADVGGPPVPPVLFAAPAAPAAGAAVRQMAPSDLMLLERAKRMREEEEFGL